MDEVSEERRAALARIAGLAGIPVGLSLLEGALSAAGLPLIDSAQAAVHPGVLANQGDLVHIPAATAPTSILAEWSELERKEPGFRIAATKAALEKSPATASRYEAKVYDFPSGSLRTLTFRKGSPVLHLITFETELYILSGATTLTPLPGHPGKPVTVQAGDALFLPSGYLNDPRPREDLVVLQAYVARSVRDARKQIVTAKQAPVSQGVAGSRRFSTKTYAFEGNAMRVITLSGGRGETTTSPGDVLAYIVKGRARRKEGDQILELGAGDCMRRKSGNSGYWEPLEETVLIETDAPITPGMLPPTAIA